MTNPARNAGTLMWHALRCDAAAVLAAMEGEHVVFVATPTAFTIAVVTAGELRTAEQTPWLLPSSTFQLTAFDGTTQLRWLADGESGRAVWLSESATALPGPPTGSQEFNARLTQRAVLWGLPDGTGPGGFSRWSEARVGRAWYPCAPGNSPRHRAVLESVEYVAADRHGSMAVFEQRLVKVTSAELIAGPHTLTDHDRAAHQLSSGHS
ncbi:MAG: type III-D CRISPR-associated protein Csx19 [Pseudonocardiaceae bacterium]